MPTTDTILDSLVARAGQLYSLPRVAVEVLELTAQPQVDVRRLKQVIETDPALTAKLLRVVNSSLYGLTREVGDLNQALAVLGTKPLKLLVLGFSLPEAMFAGAPGDLLERFWQHTLTRAVAAREISQTFCHVAGDEPFIAGLLRDLGQLVLVQELGATYIEFWRTVAENGGSLTALERHSLGFDHTQLTARLLEHWKMPTTLVEAVAAADSLPAAPQSARSRELRHILHLAELSAWLLAARHLGMLPELVEAAQAWLRLSRDELMAFLGTLQEKVAQLADLMSVKDAAIDHAEVLRQAHARLVEAATDAASELVRHALDPSPEALEAPAVFALSQTIANYAPWHVSATDRPCSASTAAPAGAITSTTTATATSPAAPARSAEARVNSASPPIASTQSGTGVQGGTPAMAGKFAKPIVAAARTTGTASHDAGGHATATGRAAEPGTRKVFPPARKPDHPAVKVELPAAPPREDWSGIEGLVASAIAACRKVRASLSLLCLELTNHAELVFALGPAHADDVVRAVEQGCSKVDLPTARSLRVDETRFVLVLSGCGRKQAVQLGDDLLAGLRRTIGRLAGEASSSVTLSAGAATIDLPPRNFPAQELIDRAARCLYAARAAGGDCLKSIEIL